MGSVAIPKEDLREMDFKNLHEQKKFLSNKDEKDLDIKTVNEQNLKNISQELHSRYTKYLIFISVGLVIGLVALRKVKN